MLPESAESDDERYRRHAGRVLDSLGDAFWESDEQGLLQFANRTLLELGGWSLHDIRGHSIDTLMSGRDGASLLIKLADGADLSDLDVQVNNYPLASEDLKLSARVTRTERGQRPVIRGILRRVPRQRPLESAPKDGLTETGDAPHIDGDVVQGSPAAIEKAERLEETLQDPSADAEQADRLEAHVRGIAYEINNILSVILGTAELGLLELEAEHPVRAEMDRIGGLTRRAAERCSELLAAASIDSAASEPLDDVETWIGSGRLLVIDEDADLRETARRMLEALGFEVILADHGRVGVQLLRILGHKLDAVLLDVTDARHDNEATLAQIRQLDQKIPVVLTSGRDVCRLAEQLSIFDVSASLQKPFGLSSLRDALRSALPEPPVRD